MSSSEIGYIADFIAGFFIIQSIIFRSKKHIRAEAATLYDGNPLIYESQLKAFWDGWFGVILLFVGLILHLIHLDFELSFSIIALAVLMFVPFMLRACIQERIKREVGREYVHYDKVKKGAEEGEY